ncbi:LysR family transcriptional regulator [Bradyrhizobium acaciae]|uniref:LysR family transcriptional regulator n=1 Tax=Bradyrhizobium acaciae TaxID=2683706 RepID=UPI001E4FA2AE|nr:LysR family transcriptional regulator [Bradyrhizobium acaciae]MCC8977719.1 LysR family transcriptional regulator [Bradyrhizobium acaciae]
MHVRDVDLNLFVVFDAIYTEGGVSRACFRLNLTQPAVSHALSRLRAMFNDPLFVRRHHLMTPTPLARQIITTVRQALNGLETTLTHTNRFDPARTPKRFVIGLRNNLEAPMLSALVNRISAVAPLVEIATVRSERNNLERELAAGTLDVAIDTLLPLSTEVRREQILTEHIAVFARRGHPELGTRLDKTAYLRMEHVCVTSRRSGVSFEDFQLQRLGLTRTVRLTCQNFATACHVVSRSNMLLTASESAASVLEDPGLLQCFPCPFPISPHVNYLYWHATAEGDTTNQWLREQLRAAASLLAGSRFSKKNRRAAKTRPKVGVPMPTSLAAE